MAEISSFPFCMEGANKWKAEQTENQQVFLVP